MWNGTEIGVLYGGTGTSTAAGARTNLGLAIGSDIQGYDADLTDLAGIARQVGDLIIGGSSAWQRLGTSTAGYVLTVTSTSPYIVWQQVSGGSGISSLNGLSGSSQTFATGTDTNLGLTIGSSGSTHTFTPTWTGSLAESRGGTGQSSFTANSLLFATSTSDLVEITASANTIPQANASGKLSFVQTLATAIQDNITRLGTIVSGVWNGTAIGTQYGGTGTSTSALKGRLLIGDGSVFTTLATSTDGLVLTASSTAPLGVVWQTASSSGSGITSVQQDTAPKLGGNLDLNSYNVKLNNYPSSNLSGEGLYTIATAGESVSSTDILYLKSDGKYWKIDADASSTMPVSVMAMANIDANATGTILNYGYFRDDSWNWTKGILLYASTTAGKITNSAPSGSADQVQIIGYAATSTVIFFNPSPVLVEIN